MNLYGFKYLGWTLYCEKIYLDFFVFFPPIIFFSKIRDLKKHLSRHRAKRNLKFIQTKMFFLRNVGSQFCPSKYFCYIWRVFFLFFYACASVYFIYINLPPFFWNLKFIPLSSDSIFTNGGGDHVDGIFWSLVPYSFII